MYFCHAAADILPELPRYLQPAPMVDEVSFSVETIWHERPFAVHQFWPHMHANDPDIAMAMFQNCPEALAIIPPHVVKNNTQWKSIICETLERDTINAASAEEASVHINELCT